MDLPPSLHTPPALSFWRTLEVGRAFTPTPCPSMCQLPSRALATWEGATQASLHPSQHLGSRVLALPPCGRDSRGTGGDVSLRGDSSFPGRRVWVQSPCRPCCGLSEPCLSLSGAGHGVRCGTRCLEAKGGTTGHHTGREGDGERRGRVLLTDRAPPVMLCFVLTAGGSPLLLDRGPSAFDVLSCVAGNGRCFLQPTQARGLVLVWRPSIR